MFQTEIIHALQALSSDFLDHFMLFLSRTLGKKAFYELLLIIILFGISFRKGLLLAHIFMWSNLLCSVLKKLAALPRPYAVDSTIELLGKARPNQAPFTRKGAPGFFDPLPERVVAYYRSGGGFSYGFPSRHASNAMAVWGAIPLVFRSPWVKALSVPLMLLIPLSRLYLGRHFLADVLGGLLLGFMLVAAAYVTVIRGHKLPSCLSHKAYRISKAPKSVLVIIYYLVIPSLLIPVAELEDVAALLGLNLGVFLLSLRGVPHDSGGLAARAARVLVAGVFYFGTDALLRLGIDLVFNDEAALLEFVRRCTTFFLTLWGSTELSIGFGFFKRSL